MCAALTLVGRCGRSRVHVCVDEMMRPSGIVMQSGSLVRCLSWTGAFGVRKCPVAPESRMAIWLSFVCSSGSSLSARSANLLKCGIIGVGFVEVKFKF